MEDTATQQASLSPSELVSRVSRLESELNATRLQLSDALSRIEQFEGTTAPSPAAGADLSSSKSSTFRLLDLPSEIRNTIYELVASSAFAVPAMALYDSSPNITPTSVVVKKLCFMHNERRGGQYRNRLAMLYTNKQIYSEASIIFYSSMTLDLRLGDSGNFWRPISQLVDIFKYRLHYVQQLEMDSRSAVFFLFFSGRVSLGNIHEEMGEEFTIQNKQEVWQFARLRTYLFSVRSVTLYGDMHDAFSYLERVSAWSQADGVRLMFQLADADWRRIASRLFPVLSDIKCLNSYGAIRLRKFDGDDWKLWYSQESIRQTWSEDCDPEDPRLMDQVTALPISTTLAYFASPNSLT